MSSSLWKAFLKHLQKESVKFIWSYIVLPAVLFFIFLPSMIAGERTPADVATIGGCILIMSANFITMQFVSKWSRGRRPPVAVPVRQISPGTELFNKAEEEVNRFKNNCRFVSYKESQKVVQIAGKFYKDLDEEISSFDEEYEKFRGESVSHLIELKATILFIMRGKRRGFVSCKKNTSSFT